MYQALYRKYRPKTFSEVVGQQHITDTLQRQVADGQVGHAYLFTGYPRHRQDHLCPYSGQGRQLPAPH